MHPSPISMAQDKNDHLFWIIQNRSDAVVVS